MPSTTVLGCHLLRILRAGAGGDCDSRLLGHSCIRTPQWPTLPQVRVEFPHKEPLCSASKPGAPYRQVVVVPATSSEMVSFVLLPLEIGKVDVEVKVMGNGVQDHIRKTLLVKVMDAPTPCF